MTDGYIYDSGMGALAPAKGFARNAKAIGGRRKARMLNFLDINVQPDQVKNAQFESQARLEFPYPPKNCQDAVSSAGALASKIASLNENIAAGVDIKSNQIRIGALSKVKSDFDVYLNKANCIAAALASEDKAFNQQWQDLLNNDQQSTSKKSSADNWLVFAALGVLIIGAVVIIFKKKKPAK